MATTASVRFVPVSCFIYRSEEAKACDKWSIFVKIKLKETMVDLRERFAINDYGGFKKQSRWKARLSARCKAQEAWSAGVFEWPAVQAPIKYLQNPWLFLSAFSLTGTILMRQLPASSITTVFTKKRRWKFRVSRAQLPRPKDQTEHYLLLHWTPLRWYWKASLDWGQRWWNSIQTSFNT